MEKKELVAVYGSLRKGFHNHFLLTDSKYIGEFDTEPMYDLFSLGSYPALALNGNTSVKMEIYEVNQGTMIRLDALEGYSGPCSPNNLYDKIDIKTPYGLAHVYVYSYPLTNKVKVECGDWKVFKNDLNQELTKKKQTEEENERLFTSRHSIE